MLLNQKLRNNATEMLKKQKSNATNAKQFKSDSTHSSNTPILSTQSMIPCKLKTQKLTLSMNQVSWKRNETCLTESSSLGSSQSHIFIIIMLLLPVSVFRF